MRGRKPKPTHLKVIAGNPGKRALNKSEPKPTLGAKCPSHLSPRAKKVWRAVAPELDRLKLLNTLSAHAVAGFCDSYARWLDATEAVRKDGEIVRAPSGYPIQNPYRAVANKAFDQWTRLAAEFGMTPSSMSRIAVEPPKSEEADPWAELA